MNGLTHEQQSLDRLITASGQLLVEGRVAEMFFRELVSHCGFKDAVDVRTFGDKSKTNLQGYLKLFTGKAAFKERVQRIGIVRDAEGVAAQFAFESVQKALTAAELPVPAAISSLEGDSPGVGIYVLPNCRDTGMLETLCLEAISETERSRGQNVLLCVDRFFDCLRQQGREPRNPTKARFAGYALGCDVVDPQLGRAAQQGQLPWDAAAFSSLKAFVHRIAGR